MRRGFRVGGVMHIYQRTISGFNLFYSLTDFLVFYTIVSSQARKLKLCLLGMCLMIDHVHFLAFPDNLKQLSRFMSACTSLYVREFNTKTGRAGSLFEPRYGSAVKMDSKKIRSAIAYMFNNPVEKLLCRRAEEYRWNFLAYYNPPRLQKSQWRRYMSRALRRSICVVDELYRNGSYLKYAILEKLYNGLNDSEQDVLTDYIITRYFPFAKDKVCGYFRSYDDMVMAINSNTGSEYEIAEMYYCKSDVPYREMIRCLKKSGVTDARVLIVAPENTKRHYLSFLKSHTSASLMQIRKFLHMPSTEDSGRTTQDMRATDITLVIKNLDD